MAHRRSRIAKRKRQAGKSADTAQNLWEIEVNVPALAEKAISSAIGILIGGLLERVIL